MSCTFWNIRRRQRAELAKKKEIEQQEKTTVNETPKVEKKVKRGGKNVK